MGFMRYLISLRYFNKFYFQNSLLISSDNGGADRSGDRNDDRNYVRGGDRSDDRSGDRNVDHLYDEVLQMQLQ